MYLTISYSYNSDVEKVQRLLNKVRGSQPYGNAWGELKIDGVFGGETQKAVRAFQGLTKKTSLVVDGIVGDETMRALENASSLTSLNVPQLYFTSNTPQTYISAPPTQLCIGPASPPPTKLERTKQTASEAYKLSSKAVGAVYKADSLTNTNEKQLAYIFTEWQKKLMEQHDGLLRRLKKIPPKAQSRVRNLVHQLEGCEKFVKRARSYGISVAVKEASGELTKASVTEFIRNTAKIIETSPLTKGISAVINTLSGIRKIIKPVIDFLNKIPGLKYLGAIEKLVKGTWSMIHGEFEKAFGLFLDALRELAEQVLIDAAVVALVAMGGWVALVGAAVVVMAAMVIDYVFFSDNPGDSLLDKHTSLKTQNVIQNNAAPWLYRQINE